MALNQTNKLAWIVDTIHKSGRITFDELSRRWASNEDISGGEELHKRTFHKWRDAILDRFGLIIECEKSGEYRYYIENEEELQGNAIESWLLKSYSMSNALIESRSIRDRILLEEIPSGCRFLAPIVEAMKSNYRIEIDYYHYVRRDNLKHTVEPYCVKLFKQRWYVIGRSLGANKITIFALDRITSLRTLTDETFALPENFSPQQYFADCYGIIVDPATKAETVRFRVKHSQANYVRDLPLHESQREVSSDGEYSIFEIYVHPTFDLMQELLWNGDELEVLEPEWFRNEVAKTIERMNNLYKK
jgi:hypothetical protein